jgi:DNA-binding response OmpR family regulator
MLRPSCPVLLIHPNDAFRKALIASLDQHHFKVTFVSDETSAAEVLRKETFRVVLLGLNVAAQTGIRTLDVLQQVKRDSKCGVIILGDPDPQVRITAPWADETLLKPVDPAYVAQRAHSYCEHR